MAVLETLYVLFKGDASGVKKSAGEASAAVKSFLGLFAGVASAAAIFSSFKSAINDVSTLGNLSRELNVNIEDLDAWGRAIERNGGTAEGFYSSLQSFAEHVGASPAVALQGLLPLADKLSKLTPFMAQKWGKSLGLDQSTIYLLQQGRREVESAIKRQKELGVTTQHDAEVTQKFNAVLSDASNAYKSFYRELSIPLLPGFTKTFEYLIDHQDAVKGALGVISLAVLGLGASFAKAFPWLTAFLAAAAGIGVAYEEVKGFITGHRETALGKLLGFKKGEPGNIRNNPANKHLENDYFLKKTFGLDLSEIKDAFNKIVHFKGIVPLIANHYQNNDSKPNITIDSIIVNTQATDATGIAASIGTGLKNQLFQANSYFDNGVMA